MCSVQTQLLLWALDEALQELLNSFSLNVLWIIRHVTWSQSLITRILNYWNLVIKNCCSELKSVKNDRKIENLFFFLIITREQNRNLFQFFLFGGQVCPTTRSHHLINNGMMNIIYFYIYKVLIKSAGRAK